MKHVLLRLKEINQHLTESEKRIAKYIIDNPDEASKLDTRSLAKETYTSASSVIRLAKKIGFNGYQELKDELKIELAIMGNELFHEETEITPDSSQIDIINKVTLHNIRSLEDTKNLLDLDTLNIVVDLIKNSNQVLFFGIGASLVVAKDFALKFARLGKMFQVNDDFHTQLLQAKNATKNDVAIVISYSGRTRDVVEAMRILKENNIPTVLITSFNKDTPAHKLADYVLYVCANEPVFRMGAMSSRISQLNLVDIIYTTYISKDYAGSIKKISQTYISKENQTFKMS